MNEVRTFSAIILFVFMVGFAFPQTRESDQILLRFEERFALLDSLIFGPEDKEPTSGIPAFVDSMQVVPDTVLTPLDSALMNRSEKQIREFKSKTGLSLTGQIYHRFDGTVGIDDDDPVSGYNDKIQVELRWYFLQSSLFRRKGHLEEIRLKEEIDRTARQNERFGVSVYYQKERFRLLHDSLLSGVLQHRVQNLILLSETHHYLLFNEILSSDDLLRILDDRAAAERMLSALPEGFPQAGSLCRPDVFIIHVDTTALIEHIHEKQENLQLLDLRIKLLEQQERNTSYWEKANIAPFVRYSYYTRYHSANSSNFDAGVSFTIPLSGEACRHKKTLRAEQEVLALEGANISERIKDQIRYRFMEIEYLNRAMEGECRRINYLKDYLRLRKSAYNNRIGEYSRLFRLKEYNTYLSCIENLIRFQYQRNCHLADLQGILSEESILRYCSVSMIPQNVNRLNQ